MFARRPVDCSELVLVIKTPGASRSDKFSTEVNATWIEQELQEFIWSRIFEASRSLHKKTVGERV